MAKITEYSKEQLEQLQKELLAQYDEYVKSGLKLDMSRGKPSAAQLDISMGMMDVLTSDSDLKCALSRRSR